MSRKSLAALTTVVSGPIKRAIPPAELNEAEAEVWRQTVATKDPAWFTADSWPMLEAYCRSVVMCRMLSAQIAARPLPAEDTPAPAALMAIDALDKLLRMRDRETKAINTLARSMRLTQQSRMRAENAATAHHRTNGTSIGPKPWEYPVR